MPEPFPTVDVPSDDSAHPLPQTPSSSPQRHRESRQRRASSTMHRPDPMSNLFPPISDSSDTLDPRFYRLATPVSPPRETATGARSPTSHNSDGIETEHIESANSEIAGESSKNEVEVQPIIKKVRFVDGVLQEGVVKSPKAEVEVEPTNTGITVVEAASPLTATGLGISFGPEETGETDDEDLSERFWLRIQSPENRKRVPFEHVDSKSFGTVREFINRRSGKHITVKLILDVFAVKAECNIRVSDEVQIRVIALHEGCAVGHLVGFTTSTPPIQRTPSGELEFFLRGGDFTIRNIEVSRELERYGIGRAMVDICLGQADAYGMDIAEVFPCSYRNNKRLEDGRDRATVFWEAMGFKLDPEDHVNRYHRLQLKDLNVIPMERLSLQ